MNIFRGQIEGKQTFPYPNVLTEEQRETLQMLVDPTSKFFAVRLRFMNNLWARYYNAIHNVIYRR